MAACGGRCRCGRRSGVSIALMAPSMAANINPQASAGHRGPGGAADIPHRGGRRPAGVVPRSSGCASTTTTPGRSTPSSARRSGPARARWRAGACSARTRSTPRAMSMAAGIFGTDVPERGRRLAAPAVVGTVPVGRGGAGADPGGWPSSQPGAAGTYVLLTVEGATVAAHLGRDRDRAGPAAGPQRPRRAPIHAERVPRRRPGTQLLPAVPGGVVFGFLSFAGFEAASTLGEETTHPTRDIPRAILGTAVFGGIYFVVVTAIEMMGFGTNKTGVAAFSSSPSLLGDLGSSHAAGWLGDVITLGTTISAFGCCLASDRGRVPADVRAGPGRRPATAAWAGPAGPVPPPRPRWSSWPSRWRST